MLKQLLGISLIFLLCLSPAMQAQKRELWGMTTGGVGAGTIFKTDSVGENMELVYSFENNGQRPAKTHFTQYINGKLYAVASGGKFGTGVIFEYDKYNNIYTRKFDFNDITTGSEPVGGLLLATNGKFYGMCKYGGQFSGGVIYEYNPAVDSFQVVFDFDTIGSGRMPEGGLIQASNGKLYGMTSSSYFNLYPSWAGTLFEFDIATKNFVTKIEFSTIYNWSPNYGMRPLGDLIQSPNGKLYGMTKYGGYLDGGVIFEYDIVFDTIVVKHKFTGGYINQHPDGSLILTANGKLYGYAGMDLFEFNPQNNQYNVKYSFNSPQSIGFWPVDRITKATNGKLYGVCRYGGSNNLGILFEYNPQNGQVVKKVDFDGVSKGSYPLGGLFLAPNGILYGMTSQGGIGGLGTIFEYSYDTTNIFVKGYDFAPSSNGKNPYGSLLLASNGKFYGMTRNGGVYNKGVLFEFDPGTYLFTKKFDFNDTIGSFPYGSLMEASNGKLYGTASGPSMGTFFEYDYQNDIISIKNCFYGGNFCGYPKGDIVQGSPIKLYGTTSDYCAGRGGIFEYDMIFDTLYPRYIFGSYLGRNSEGSLVKMNNAYLIGLFKNGG
ncbi:MAG: hypothetical protein DRI84_06025, partial [Bacteroidetes bacterium]